MKPIPENTVNKVLEAAILGGYIRPGGRTERENDEYTMVKGGKHALRGNGPL